MAMISGFVTSAHSQVPEGGVGGAISEQRAKRFVGGRMLAVGKRFCDVRGGQDEGRREHGVAANHRVSNAQTIATTKGRM